MISVVLLRGINVGGHRPIVMTDLRVWLSNAGFTRVETYIHSGNALIEHAPTLDVTSVVHDVIHEASGFKVPVVSRSASEFILIATSNPFSTTEPSRLHVSFLAQTPDAETVLTSSRHNWQREEFRVVGREVFLHLPDGVGKSPMASKLALIKDATTRNWRTVLALESMLTAYS